MFSADRHRVLPAVSAPRRPTNMNRVLAAALSTGIVHTVASCLPVVTSDRTSSLERAEFLAHGRRFVHAAAIACLASASWWHDFPAAGYRRIAAMSAGFYVRREHLMCWAWLHLHNPV